MLDVCKPCARARARACVFMNAGASIVAAQRCGVLCVCTVYPNVFVLLYRIFCQGLVTVRHSTEDGRGGAEGRDTWLGMMGNC